MADPLEGVLDPPAPDPEPQVQDPATELAEARAQIERERLQREALQAQLQANGQNLNDLREQLARNQAPAAPTPDAGDPNAEYWTDPAAFTERIATKAIQSQVAPQAAGINAKLGQMAIQNFLGSKTGDPFFAAVSPIFNEKLKAYPREALGAQADAQIQQTLEIAWDASIGSYVQSERTKRAAAAPANLGGGGQGAGGKPVKKSLAEIDPGAYNMAMSAGMTPEQIQAVADELQEDEE